MAEVSRQELWQSTGVLEAVSAHPEQLLSVQEGLASEFSNLTKALYDFHKSQAALNFGSPLNELLIENFDEEQIWQQLELQNNAVLGYFQNAVHKTVKDRDLYILQLSEEEDEEEEEAAEESENADEEDDMEGESEEEQEKEPEPIPDDSKGRKRNVSGIKIAKKSPAVEKFSDDDSDMDFDIDKLEQQNKKKPRKKPLKRPGEKSIVDDQFFKLSEMEAFLEAAEKEDGKDNEDDDEEVDYFEDIESDDDEEEDEVEFQTGKAKQMDAKSARNLQYKDFFDPVEGDGDGDGDEDEDEADRQLSEEDNEKSEDGRDEMEHEEEDASELDEDEEGMMEETEEGRKAKAAFKRVTFDLSDDSEGEDVGDILGGGKKNQETPQELISSFEKREQKMSEKIQTLQKQMLEEKSWQLSGEVTAQKRPENSLLSESLVFDHASRTAPTVTEETTLQLEDIIKQRIKDQVWDDVVRKEKPKEDAFEYKKKLTLDHDKSKQSLAEIYEQEYLKLNQKKVEEEENPKHVEIQKFMDSLFLKLDALSNFHFTPKPPVPEIKVVSNLPAISMEEVAPVGVSEATLLAPEEVKEKNKAGDIKTNAEKTSTDKKRERRQKKALKRFKIKEKEQRQRLIEKQRAEKGKKQTKEAAEANLKKLTKEGKATMLKDEGKDKALKSSQAFFSQLQDQVKSQIKGAKSAQKKPKKNNELSAHKLKL
ncbi:U3 small nucleolar ribonucleoprotein protein MPP10 [Pyxicephalus adspersus]|uniref:U3 small nucleolar ribonucleoprotein protein MPP10 n=1 Tax=Pyxicephalus adspersus TaxID=30357 RepID=UPI003B59212D